MSGSSLALDLVEPAYRTFPESFTTLGPEVADLAAQIGFPPDPEQRMLLDDMYAMKRDRTPAAFEFVVICSRQNLKTGLFKIAAIADAFYFHDELVTWTAHRYDTTEGAFRDIKKLIDASDMLTRRVRKITEGTGDQEITLVDGCVIQFRARGPSGLRGKSGGKLFLDEGFALTAAHIGSVYPITATLPGAQIRIGSSAGLQESEVLRDIRDRGRKGDVGLAYTEWSDNEPPICERPDCDHHRDAPNCCLDDRARWRRSNPAMGRRITEERIASFRRSMPAAEFAREFLGWWDEPGADALAIDAADWEKLTVQAAAMSAVSAFGIAVSRDREWGSIGAAGPQDNGNVLLESIEHRPGSSWVVNRCIELNQRWSPSAFIVDSAGPAASLINDLEDAGLRVETTTTQDIAIAYADLVDAVKNRKIVHGPQLELAAAVGGARKRAIGDGMFALGRKASGGDITPLEAVELALWGHNQFGAVSASAYVI